MSCLRGPSLRGDGWFSFGSHEGMRGAHMRPVPWRPLARGWFGKVALALATVTAGGRAWAEAPTAPAGTLDRAAALVQARAFERAAVVLQVQEELATYEIAAVLKCSEATVRVHLHRAMNALKKTMTDKEKR